MEAEVFSVGQFLLEVKHEVLQLKTNQKLLGKSASAMTVKMAAVLELSRSAAAS